MSGADVSIADALQEATCQQNPQQVSRQLCCQSETCAIAYHEPRDCLSSDACNCSYTVRCSVCIACKADKHRN